MDPLELHYETRGGLRVSRASEQVEIEGAIDPLIDALDSRRGALLTSTYEYPGRYTRWDMGFTDPALGISATGHAMSVRAFNERGCVVLGAVRARLAPLADAGVLNGFESQRDHVALTVNRPTRRFTEEERSRQPSVFSVLREIVDLLGSDDDHHLGLYGSFGYDLVFQFEPMRQHLPRHGDQRDLVLYLPDDLLVVDHKRESAFRHRYDFEWEGHGTTCYPRPPDESRPFVAQQRSEPTGDHAPGEYATVVDVAKESFARGDLFEVVPSQTFSEASVVPPSELYRRLRRTNPAPYGALMNLGNGEFLISASPEMYVRVEGRKVETCPIAGTIRRGADVLADAEQIRELMNSDKDESELTMCTDVDRNDKSRICVPGSVQIIGRRMVETYSRLFHTVDHVIGELLPQFDALDAFLTHMWAVTVTGAPKVWAMRFIEEHERSPRAWYGGAIGAILFDGNMNTGLTLRTIHVRDGRTSVRVGATLLMDSDPAAEEEETHTKAAALLAAIRDEEPGAPAPSTDVTAGAGLRIALVDYEDSFVHTLASYFRETGASVTTVRVGVGESLDPTVLAELDPDLVVLSPGPGRPEDFDVDGTVRAARQRDLPVFGVCLGLQGIVEAYGGKLSTMVDPMHGRASVLELLEDPSADHLFAGIDGEVRVGRYHSLYADEAALPEDLVVTARADDGIVMAVQHRTEPVMAVQFHPESLMTLRNEAGRRIVANVVRTAQAEKVRRRSA